MFLFEKRLTHVPYPDRQSYYTPIFALQLSSTSLQVNSDETNHLEVA
jgi:hypothetical protein